MMIDLELRAGVRLSTGRALFLAATRTLVVADVHWGYAASQRAAGRLLPQWGDAEIEARLEKLLAFYAPRELVLLGDSVHAPAGASAAREALARLFARVPVVLVTGNHDRGGPVPTIDEYEAGEYHFHHGHAKRSIAGDRVEVIGHHHPAAVWGDGAGTRVKMPALVEGPRRLILPAFSPWAAGVVWNWQLEPGERLWLISPRRIVPVAHAEAEAGRPART